MTQQMYVGVLQEQGTYITEIDDCPITDSLIFRSSEHIDQAMLQPKFFWHFLVDSDSLPTGETLKVLPVKTRTEVFLNTGHKDYEAI